MKAKLQAAKLACAACPVRTNLQLCLEEEEDGEAEAEVKHDAEDDDEAEAEVLESAAELEHDAEDDDFWCEVVGCAEVPESAALDANAFLDVLTRFDPTTVLAKASWPQLAMCERVCVVLRRWARREADARISRVRYASMDIVTGPRQHHAVVMHEHSRT